MSELGLFFAFLVLSVAAWLAAPDVLFGVSDGGTLTAMQQMTAACIFSAVLTGVLQLTKLFVNYRRFRANYYETRAHFVAARSSKLNLLAGVAKRIAATLFFAGVILLSFVKEPTRPQESLRHFLILAMCVYIGLGAVLDTLKFLPLIVGRIHRE